MTTTAGPRGESSALISGQSSWKVICTHVAQHWILGVFSMCPCGDCTDSRDDPSKKIVGPKFLHQSSSVAKLLNRRRLRSTAANERIMKPTHISLSFEDAPPFFGVAQLPAPVQVPHNEFLTVENADATISNPDYDLLTLLDLAMDPQRAAVDVFAVFLIHALSYITRSPRYPINWHDPDVLENPSHRGCVERGEYLETRTIVSVHRPDLPRPDRRWVKGMKALENRHIILSCYAAFKGFNLQ
ncbi:hypothetical protein B0H19DRAFT_1237226 [Mycena capillaripes]|nr:hypothetical protein B0H19DRAFT_1237226 [Mycena capillaripes]